MYFPRISEKPLQSYGCRLGFDDMNDYNASVALTKMETAVEKNDSLGYWIFDFQKQENKNIFKLGIVEHFCNATETVAER